MICKAYRALVGNDVKLELVGNTIDGVVWLDSRPQPSKSAVEAKIAELQKEYDDLEYSRSRAEAYPAWGVQLDYIYHNGVDKWKTDIVDPIKTKFPKP
tara:strand:- start:175 stop:468 length:294 start_codon:yes stop_codon:yes gene_type:complete